MKERYNELEAEVLHFETTDIIITSGDDYETPAIPITTSSGIF